MNQNNNYLGNLENDFPKFMEKILDFISKLKLDISGLEIDHIAIRIKDSNKVDIMKKELNLISYKNCPVSTAIVNGREIMIYKLQKPLI